MTVTVDDFRNAFPEFAAVPDSAVTAALETAQLLWSERRLGKFWSRVVMLSVARAQAQASSASRMQTMH